MRYKQDRPYLALVSPMRLQHLKTYAVPNQSANALRHTPALDGGACLSLGWASFPSEFSLMSSCASKLGVASLSAYGSILVHSGDDTRFV